MIELNNTVFFRLFYNTRDDQENIYFVTDAPAQEVRKIIAKHKSDEFSTFQAVEKEIKDKGYSIQEIRMLEFDFNYD